ncbi:Raf-like protein [delta proteobacterium NaphS2]|nr:Raf-like protein [delta proteobacterium NaphS2]
MFTLSSSAFKDGSVIPDKYVEDSLISPPLKWENPPAGTECFAIVLLDQDIPGQFRDNLGRGFVHWIALVPATLSELAEGASPGNMPPGSVQFKTDFVNMAIPGYGNHYGGPWPPDAPHRYTFLLFALKSTPNLSPNSEVTEIGNAIFFNTIDVARLIGVYGPAKKPLSA